MGAILLNTVLTVSQGANSIHSIYRPPDFPNLTAALSLVAGNNT